MSNCDQASRLMSERLDHHLRPADMELLDSHMRGCAVRQVRWLRMRRIQSLFQTADAVAPPPHFTARVMRRLEARERETAAYAAEVERVHLGLSLAGAALTALFLAVLMIGAQVGGVKESALVVSSSVTRGALALEAIVNALKQVSQIVPLPAVLAASLWIILGTLGLSYTLGSIVASYWPTSGQLARTAIRTQEG